MLQRKAKLSFKQYLKKKSFLKIDHFHYNLYFKIYLSEDEKRIRLEIKISTVNFMFPCNSGHF